MTLFSSFTAGFSLVNRSLKYILLIYGVNLALGIAFSWVIASMLEESFGTDLSSMRTEDVFDALRHTRISDGMQELAQTLDPGKSQFGTVLRGFDAFMSGDLTSGIPAVVVSGILYLVVWLFFSGGLISIYTGKGENNGFIRNSLNYFPQFLIIALFGLALYYLVFSFGSGWLTYWITAQMRDQQSENVHLAYMFLQLGITWILVFFVNIILDYSKVFVVTGTVSNFAMSALTGILTAGRTVMLHLPKTFGLYLLLGLVWVALAAVYWLIIPGAENMGWLLMFWMFFSGQLFILARIWLRCFFYSAQAVMGMSLSEIEGEKGTEEDTE